MPNISVYCGSAADIFYWLISKRPITRVYALIWSYCIRNIGHCNTSNTIKYEWPCSNNFKFTQMWHWPFLDQATYIKICVRRTPMRPISNNHRSRTVFYFPLMLARNQASAPEPLKVLIRDSLQTTGTNNYFCR